jgi:hypothetical protein
MGYVSKKIFLKIFVTTVFDLETSNLVCVIRIPLIEHAEKMVKICQTGLLKLNFETRPKNAFSDFCQQFSQAMDEVENFFLPVSKSLAP